MAISNLNHVNIRTAKLEETRAFYEDVLGLTVGKRPPLSSPGYWLYCGDVPVVHLSEIEADATPRTNPEGMGDGLDHVGFAATGLGEQLERLEKRGIAYRKGTAATGFVQIFFEDPNGIIVELGFAGG